MSRRNDDDALLKAFLSDYKINLLKIPRQGASVGDLYVEKDGVVSPPTRLQSVLVPKLEMPKVEDEKMADIATIKTRAIELKVGIGLLEGFFSAVGAAGIAAKIKASYEHTGAGKIRFQLLNATRDHVDPGELGDAIAKCKFNSKNPLLQGADAFYVTVAVVRSPSITITAEDNNSNQVAVEAGALQNAVGVDGKISVKNEASGALTYQAATPLAFGVELVELKYDEKNQQFAMAGMNRAIPIRKPGDIQKVLVGDPEAGDVFLNMAG